MKRKLLQVRKMLLVAAGLLVGVSSVWAEDDNTAKAVVKMTYVDNDNADTAAGEIPDGETARSGYNKISGGAVGFGNTGWKVNFITYLQVDATAIEGNVIEAKLTFEGSGSTDSNRTTSWGVGYNDSEWSSEMTYNTADKSITTIGSVKAGTTKSATTFESFEFDITEALQKDDSKKVTILVYETAAAGGYIKKPSVTVTYTKDPIYKVTFAESNNVNATITYNGRDITKGTKLPNGTYKFTATASGYFDYEGEFIVSDGEETVSYTMEKKEPVTSITVNYTYNNETIVSENQENIEGLYAGVQYTIPFRRYVMKDGILYETKSSSGTYYYGESTTLKAENSIDRALSIVDLKGGAVEFFVDLDDSNGDNADIRASYCSAYNNKAYTSEEELLAGVYTFIVYAQSKGRGSSVKIGETTVFTITDVVGTKSDGSENKGAWTLKTISNIEVPVAGNLSIAAGGSNTRDCYDIIIAIRHTEVSATITEAGWATLYTPFALDFSEIDDLAAYTATYDNETVTLAKVENVPANTGVVLKGVANTYKIPVIFSSEATGTQGDLKGSATASLTYDENATNDYYMLALNEDKEAQFTKLGSGSIAAGKAYLELPKKTTAAEARVLNVVFAGETTGIAEVATVGAENGAIYNLSGQRVSKPAQGLYIVNGKKVIIK